MELERQEAEAQQRMDAELEKKRLEAADQLNKQRHLYEDRLAELNQLLVSRSSISVSFVKGSKILVLLNYFFINFIY